MLELRVHAPNNAWIQARGSPIAYYYVGDGAADRARRERAAAFVEIAAGAPLGAVEAGLTGVRVNKNTLRATKK